MVSGGLVMRLCKKKYYIYDSMKIFYYLWLEVEMNSISTKDLLPFSGMELKNAEHILEKFGSRRFSSEDYYYNVVFKKEYDGSTDDISLPFGF